MCCALYQSKNARSLSQIKPTSEQTSKWSPFIITIMVAAAAAAATLSCLMTRNAQRVQLREKRLRRINASCSHNYCNCCCCCCCWVAYAILPKLDKLLNVNDQSGICALESKKLETGYLFAILSNFLAPPLLPPPCFAFSLTSSLLFVRPNHRAFNHNRAGGRIVQSCAIVHTYD